MRNALRAIALFLFSIPALAQNPPTVRRVEFRGLEQTDPSFLEKELLLHPGDAFSEIQLLDSSQRLRNLRIFREVSAEVIPAPEETVDVVFHIAEKQTLLPFFRLKRGGGATLVVVGIGDLNAFGRGIELLPMYENLNSRWHGGRLEGRVPRPFGGPGAVEGQMGRDTRLHSLFDARGARGHWRQSRWQTQLDWERPLSSDVTLVPGLAFSLEETGLDGLNAQQESTNSRFGFRAPQDGSITRTTLRIDVGRLDWFDYRARGLVISPQVSLMAQAGRVLGKAQLQARGHAMPFPWLDLAFRFHFQSGSEMGFNPVTSQCSLGGFAEVRGFLEERFRGNSCWYSNGEVRWAALRHPYIVLQPTAFADLGSVSPSPAPFAFHAQKDPSAAGVGFRLVFPSLARLAIRFDYAFRLTGPRDDAPISLGSQQFF